MQLLVQRWNLHSNVSEPVRKTYPRRQREPVTRYEPTWWTYEQFNEFWMCCVNFIVLFFVWVL